MKTLALLILFLPSAALAQGSFIFDDAPVAKAKPAATIRPVSPNRAKRVAATPVADRDNRATAAKSDDNCVSCSSTRRPGRSAGLAKIDIARIEPDTSAYGNACIRTALLESAKRVARNRYGNRPRSGGKCARGVGHMLNEAGMSRSFRIGDAISWHNAGHLRRLGFKNIMRAGLTAENAPAGAVLVFRGPNTNMSHPNGGLPSRRYRRGRSAGNWVGHVSIKGDKPNTYYTDARTEDPAIAGRTLVGIYVPVSCGNNCTGKARACVGG